MRERDFLICILALDFTTGTALAVGILNETTNDPKQWTQRQINGEFIQINRYENANKHFSSTFQVAC